MGKLDNIKGIIFDLDGTILDSCSIWEDVDKDFFNVFPVAIPQEYSIMIL